MIQVDPVIVKKSKVSSFFVVFDAIFVQFPRDSVKSSNTINNKIFELLAQNGLKTQQWVAWYPVGNFVTAFSSLEWVSETPKIHQTTKARFLTS